MDNNAAYGYECRVGLIPTPPPTKGVDFDRFNERGEYGMGNTKRIK
jgi:hypothetical protein